MPEDRTELDSPRNQNGSKIEGPIDAVEEERPTLTERLNAAHLHERSLMKPRACDPADEERHSKFVDRLNAAHVEARKKLKLKSQAPKGREFE